MQNQVKVDLEAVHRRRDEARAKGLYWWCSKSELLALLAAGDRDLRGTNLWRAVLQGANLQGANLQGADLQETVLQGANLQETVLRGANLWGAKHILRIGPWGDQGNETFAVHHANGVTMVQAGGFWGTLDAFKDAVRQKDDPSRKLYEAGFSLLDAFAELNT